MSIYPEIVRNAIVSPTLTVLSYIKPGVYHRYSTDRELLDITGVGAAVYDVIVEAVEGGVRVSKGNIPASSIQLGRMLCKVLRRVFAWTGRVDVVAVEMVLLYPLIALTLSYLKYRGLPGESQLYRSINMFLTASTKSDALEVYSTVKLMGFEEYINAMEDYGISKGRIEVESYNVYDIFRALSRSRLVYHSIIDYSITSSTVREITSVYERTGDLNYAIVRGYIALLVSYSGLLGLESSDVKVLKEILSKHTIPSKEVLKLLYSLDRRFRGYSRLVDVLPVLSNATFIALTLSIKP